MNLEKENQKPFSLKEAIQKTNTPANRLDIDVLEEKINFLNEEIKVLKAKSNKLERYYHSNLKYIKDLYAAVDQLKKNHNHNGNHKNGGNKQELH
jgi:uncharacterized small protein (DUF1192 family)